MLTTSRVLTSSVMMIALAGLSACGGDSAEETGEAIGKQVDTAVEKTQEAASAAKEEVSEAAEKAGDKIESATD
jgi:hypothetical protein